MELKLSLLQVAYWCGSFVLLFGYHSNGASIVLTLSVEEDGRGVACPGEVVTFTCRALQAASLSWNSESFDRPIDFLSTDTERTVVKRGGFEATLTRVDLDLSNIPYGNMSSTLTITALHTVSRMVVECDIITAMGDIKANKTIFTTSQPLRPQNPQYSVLHYNRYNVSIIVEWDYPEDGPMVDSYIIAFMNSSLTSKEHNITLFLSYNESYTIDVIATNCAGSSDAVTLKYFAGDITPSHHAADCGDPEAPLNGSVEEYDATTVGSEIFYQCNAGLTPRGQFTAVCVEDETWDPNPADLVCIKPLEGDCGSPNSPQKGYVEAFNSTVDGSVILYQCNPGLVPDIQMIAVCTNNTWTPNPALLLCSDPNLEVIPTVFLLLVCSGFIIIIITWRNRNQSKFKKTTEIEMRANACYGPISIASPPTGSHQQIETTDNIAYSYTSAHGRISF